MPGKIHVERMMYRTSVAVTGESAASYALVKLIPSAEFSPGPVQLNVCLVLDVSGSMYEEDGTGSSRLKRIQDAARAAIAKLKPDDWLSVVAFAHNALLVLPTTSVREQSAIRQVIERIDMYEVDPGGTAMDQGLELALAELGKNSEAARLAQIIVLTDGETSGEQRCRELAQKAAGDKVRFSVMGIGTEWNATLIKDLARLSEGHWYYVDVDQASETARVFLEEFEHLAATGFTNVTMHLSPIKDVRVKRVRQVVPEIKDLPLQETVERHLICSLGALERDKPTRYILDLSLPKRPDGNFVILQVEIQYDVGGRSESTGKVPLQIQYTEAGQGYVNAEVARHVDEVQIYELNKNLQEAIASNDQAEARRVAETISRKGELLGPRAAKKTMLARQVLSELQGGRVSKKTQLAVDDAARLAEEMPLPT